MFSLVLGGGAALAGLVGVSAVWAGCLGWALVFAGGGGQFLLFRSFLLVLKKFSFWEAGH